MRPAMVALFQKGGRAPKQPGTSKQRKTLLSSKQPANHSLTDRSQGTNALMTGHCNRCDESQADERYTGRSIQLSFPVLLCSTDLVQSCTSSTGQASITRSRNVPEVGQKNLFEVFVDRNDSRAYHFFKWLDTGCNTGFKERTKLGQTWPT